MARRFMIVIAGVLGVAVFIAFLALGGREAPMPVAMDEQRLAAISSKPVVRSDPEPVPERAASVEVSDMEAPTDVRWAECANAIPDELPPALDGLGEGRTPPIVATLSASGSAEHVLAGALLRPNNDPDAIRADIERALALDSGHPLVLWHALNLCYANPNIGYCSSRAFRENVAEQLSSNAAFWARRAVADVKQTDEAAALAAMRRAAAAPEIDSYYDEHVLLFERALSVTPDMSYTHRAIVAIGLAATVSSLGSRTARVCGRQSESSTLWRDACISWADRLVSDNDTLAETMMGHSLMASLYERAGRDDLAKAASADEAELGTLLNGAVVVEDLLQADHGLMVAYIDQLTSNGEIAALKFASAEAQRLKADPDYDPCALTVR